MPNKFEPGNLLFIEDRSYKMAEHPLAPGMPYGQEGRRAVVYQLVSESNDKFALKVFKTRFRVPSMVRVAELLQPYASLDGLQACQRTVLTGSRHSRLLRENPDLTYAVLMPWVKGSTWQEILLDPEGFSQDRSLGVARAFSSQLMTLEENRLAHCDLSGANLILQPGDQPGLVDLEEMYGPGFMEPKEIPAGSPGYAHKSAPSGIWSDETDRFAGAVLLSEMLSWSDPQVREAAWGESYFAPKDMQTENKRLDVLRKSLETHYGSRILDLFNQAWRSDSLRDCPTFAEWAVALPDKVRKIEGRVTALENQAQAQQGIPVDIKGKPKDKEETKQPDRLCPVCGTHIPEGQKICPRCEGVRNTENGGEKTPAKNSTKCFLGGLVIVLGVILINLGKEMLSDISPTTPIQTVSPAPILMATAKASPFLTPPETNTVGLSSTSTPAALPSSTISPTQVSPYDGMVMVYIPGGKYPLENQTYLLNDFWMDQHEVTYGQFLQFIKDTGHTAAPCGEEEDHPVACVNWFSANAYCNWAGRRLPTEAEWEKAARGGLEGKMYPWGDEDPVCSLEAVNGSQYISCAGRTAPVKTFAPNGYGLYDMSGNVWEWVNDLAVRYTDTSVPFANSRVLKGGSWYQNSNSIYVTTWTGVYPDTMDIYSGFRCAISSP